MIHLLQLYIITLWSLSRHQALMISGRCLESCWLIWPDLVILPQIIVIHHLIRGLRHCRLLSMLLITLLPGCLHFTDCCLCMVFLLLIILVSYVVCIDGFLSLLKLINLSLQLFDLFSYFNGSILSL